MKTSSSMSGHGSAARLPQVVLLATGGTIAGYAADAGRTATYQAGALNIETLLAAVPGLTDVARVRPEQIAQIDSKDMTCGLWLTLAERINAVLAEPDVDGVVITHGTDTLEETAYFLHLTVKSNKPVVMTAAMRPATALSADGPLNLLNAVRVAAHPEAAGQGVLVVVNHQIHCARDVVKTSTYSVQAFQSPEIGVLGWVQDEWVELQRRALRPHTVQSEFDVAGRHALPMVEVLSSYANASTVPVEALVRAGVRGLVVAGTGNGSLYGPLQQALAEAARQGVRVVRASRTGAGHVMRNGAAADDTLGFVSAGNLHPYKARVLAMLALAHDIPADRWQGLFETY
ncbi:MAG: type II asparaginase [Burkholderiales bacterium]|nr:type II asparaginase [Burkholderiales bacterium]